MDKGCLFDCEGFREMEDKNISGYVPIEMYQQMVSGEKDMRRKIQEMYNDLKEDFEVKQDTIARLHEKIKRLEKDLSVVGYGRKS